MPKIKKIIILNFLIIFAFHNKFIYAMNYTCPATYQTIVTGFTFDQVRNACGEPSKITNESEKTETPSQAEQWVYTLPNIIAQKLPIYAPQLVITFNNDKVTEISVNNQSTINIFRCYSSGRIKFGDSKNTVLNECGTPMNINMIQKTTSSAVELIKWTYNFGHYQPEIVVTFKEGVVTAINSKLNG